jgi:hypothetical protein
MGAFKERFNEVLIFNKSFEQEDTSMTFEAGDMQLYAAVQYF